MNEKAFFSLTYGLFVLTANNDGFDNGCIVNTVIQAALVPNTIIVSLSKENYTSEMIQKAGKFNVSVLSEDAKFSMFERFGFQSGRSCNKFDGFDNVQRAENGLLYITEGTNAYFCCTVRETVDSGSHLIFIADVNECETLSDAPSMTYAYYFANVKPKPTQVNSESRVWICKICGYAYDESVEKVKFEDLPDDWVCPLCKHPKSDFELQ